MGPAEGGHYNLLHPTDPGGAPIPAREPDRPPRYQGTRKRVERDLLTARSSVTSLWCANDLIANSWLNCVWDFNKTAAFKSQC